MPLSGKAPALTQRTSTQRKSSIRAYIVVIVLILSQLGLKAHAFSTQPDDLRGFREVRHVMGTLLDITLYHHDAKEARKLLDSAFSLAQRLDDLLSNYKSQSEVERLNQRAGAGKVKVSPELYDFLALSKELWKKTDGAFDVTVGPLMQLWKEAERKTTPPTPHALRGVVRLAGTHHLILYGNSEVELTQKGMTIDTGGIGKGYAVDQIAVLLKQTGVSSALINFGQSSIYAMGSPPHAHTWRLLLEFPGQSPVGILELKDQALSASDAQGRFFEIAGRRYGHLIDPREGTPTTERAQAVVLARSAADAEALSKYVILRGWKKREEVKAWGAVQIMRMDQNGATQCSPNFPLISRTGVLCLRWWPGPALPGLGP